MVPLLKNIGESGAVLEKLCECGVCIDDVESSSSLPKSSWGLDTVGVLVGDMMNDCVVDV